MWFRLHDNTIVELGDSYIDLCEFFSIIQTDINIAKIARDVLAPTVHAGVASAIGDVLQHVDMKYLADSTCKAACLSKIRESRFLDGYDSQTQMAISQGVQYLFESKQYTEAVQSIIHRITFLTDRTLLQVINFLSIPCTTRHRNMFDVLPQQMRNNGTLDEATALQLQAYLSFVETLNDDDCLTLVRAACLLNIEPLVTLIAFKLSQVLISTSEDQIRQKFNIPHKFKQSINEKLDKLMSSSLNQQPFNKH